MSIEDIIKKHGGRIDTESLAKKHGALDFDKLAKEYGATKGTATERLIKIVNPFEVGEREQIIREVIKRLPEKQDVDELIRAVLKKVPKPKKEIVEKIIPDEKLERKIRQLERIYQDITRQLSFRGTSYGGETTNFTQLTDVPNSYSGQALKTVRVNAGATALEFATGGGGASIADHFIITQTDADLTNATNLGSLTTGLLKGTVAGGVSTISSITDNSGNWNTAYGWGNHALAGYALATNVVPYTGATTNVDLGAHNLTIDTNTFFVDSTNNRVGILNASPKHDLSINTRTNIAEITGDLYFFNNIYYDGANFRYQTTGSANCFVMKASGNFEYYTTPSGTAENVATLTLRFKIDSTTGAITTGTWNATSIGDSYISSATNWNTAYGWGNHALAGYLTSVTAHNLLSVTHGDTVSASPVLGDILYGNTTPNWTKLAGNTTTTKKFLRQTGTGAISAIPAWDTLVDGDIPSALTNKTYNALTLTALATGFSIAGGTTSKTLTVDETASLTGYAKKTDNLSVFAATTSAQLAGVISDETGSGALVFATSPTLVTPTLGVATGTRLGLGQAADASAVMAATGQYFSAKYTCTTTLDWNNANVQYIVLANGAQTFTFANPKDGGRYLLLLKQPTSGAAGTVTWPAIVLWSGGTAPTLTATNGKVDVIAFAYDATNTKYYGSSALNY